MMKISRNTIFVAFAVRIIGQGHKLFHLKGLMQKNTNTKNIKSTQYIA